MKKTILSFSALIILLLALFQLSKYAMISNSGNPEIIITIVAVAFFFVGIYINKKMERKSDRDDIKNQEIRAIEKGLSKREFQVLKLLSLGYSNKEIGDKLFLSESTIKTHVSNLLLKLEARRRTEAVQLAKEAGILD